MKWKPIPLEEPNIRNPFSQKFKQYCVGKLRSCPWSELDGLQPESKIINEQLGNVNLKGILTINSQPAVDGANSDSPSVGELSILFMWTLSLSEPLIFNTWTIMGVSINKVVQNSADCSTPHLHAPPPILLFKIPSTFRLISSLAGENNMGLKLSYVYSFNLLLPWNRVEVYLSYGEKQIVQRYLYLLNRSKKYLTSILFLKRIKEIVFCRTEK